MRKFFCSVESTQTHTMKPLWGGDFTWSLCSSPFSLTATVVFAVEIVAIVLWVLASKRRSPIEVSSYNICCFTFNFYSLFSTTFMIFCFLSCKKVSELYTHITLHLHDAKLACTSSHQLPPPLSRYSKAS